MHFKYQANPLRFERQANVKSDVNLLKLNLVFYMQIRSIETRG